MDDENLSGTTLLATVYKTFLQRKHTLVSLPRIVAIPVQAPENPGLIPPALMMYQQLHIVEIGTKYWIVGQGEIKPADNTDHYAADILALRCTVLDPPVDRVVSALEQNCGQFSQSVVVARQNGLLSFDHGDIGKKLLKYLKEELVASIIKSYSAHSSYHYRPGLVGPFAAALEKILT